MIWKRCCNMRTTSTQDRTSSLSLRLWTSWTLPAARAIPSLCLTAIPVDELSALAAGDIIEDRCRDARILSSMGRFTIAGITEEHTFCVEAVNIPFRSLVTHSDTSPLPYPS